jgi:hypothetical protein
MEEAMPRATPALSQGICTTCSYHGGCLFNQASKYPVWHCDHFDTQALPVPARAALQVARPPRLKAAASDK